jgi:hypothetical protein
VALDGRQAQDSTAAEAKDNGPAHVGADVEGSGGVVETKGQQDTIVMTEEDDVDDDDPQVCGSCPSLWSAHVCRCPNDDNGSVQAFGMDVKYELLCENPVPIEELDERLLARHGCLLDARKHLLALFGRGPEPGESLGTYLGRRWAYMGRKPGSVEWRQLGHKFDAACRALTGRELKDFNDAAGCFTTTMMREGAWANWDEAPSVVASILLTQHTKGKQGLVAFAGANIGRALTIGGLTIDEPRGPDLEVLYFDALTHLHDNLRYGDEEGLAGVEPGSLLGIGMSCLLSNPAILGKWLRTALAAVKLQDGLVVITDVLGGQSDQHLRSLVMPMLDEYKRQGVVRGWKEVENNEACVLSIIIFRGGAVEVDVGIAGDVKTVQVQTGQDGRVSTSAKGLRG